MPFSKQKFLIRFLDEQSEREIVFDRLLRRWILYDETLIPWTYSMAPSPSTVAMELDYFIRSACLVKHKYVWCTNDGPISRDLFGRLNSQLNNQMIERFANFEQSPTVLRPAKIHNGFLVVSWNDPRENIFRFQWQDR